MDVDKEQAKINREDAKLLGFCLDTKIMEAHTCLGMCGTIFMFQFLVIPITNWVCALRGTTIDLPT